MSLAASSRSGCALRSTTPVTWAINVPRRHTSSAQQSGRVARLAALPDRAMGGLDIKQLSDVINATSLDDPERQSTLQQIAAALDEPMGTVKNMAFRQKALKDIDPAEVKAKVETVAKIVEVPYEKARQMAIIQPTLLTDTQRMAEALAAGLRLICYDLRAPKDEIVDLLLSNPSLLHGRQMRLSAADMAHLALLREPKGRIVE